jgi:hypothetical protein
VCEQLFSLAELLRSLRSHLEANRRQRDQNNEQCGYRANRNGLFAIEFDHGPSAVTV